MQLKRVDLFVTGQPFLIAFTQQLLFLIQLGIINIQFRAHLFLRFSIGRIKAF